MAAFSLYRSPTFEYSCSRTTNSLVYSRPWIRISLIRFPKSVSDSMPVGGRSVILMNPHPDDTVSAVK